MSPVLREDLTIEDVILLRRLIQNHWDRVEKAYEQIGGLELMAESFQSTRNQTDRIVGNLSEILQGSTEGVAGYRIEPQFDWD